MPPGCDEWRGNRHFNRSDGCRSDRVAGDDQVWQRHEGCWPSCTSLLGNGLIGDWLRPGVVTKVVRQMAHDPSRNHIAVPSLWAKIAGVLLAFR
jgi:hypothetical protein